MNISDSNLEPHLRAALQEADDDAARYHIREALQLRVAEKASPGEST